MCILEHSISNISSQFVHFFKAIAPCWWWAHRKYFTELDVASPTHPPCGLRAYGTVPRSFKRHTTWLIMILGIRAHSVRFQLTVQIDKVSSDFYVFTKRWRFFLWDCVGWKCLVGRFPHLSIKESRASRMPNLTYLRSFAGFPFNIWFFHAMYELTIPNESKRAKPISTR